uniref:CPBP family glutamic-type intramembrane protease n=1 Tax=Halovivax sp. TaxID=1935978 RepID=UPI0025C452A8
MGPNGPRRRLPALARAAEPWGFPVGYLGWAFLFWAPIVVSGESVWSFPNVVLFVVGGSSPLLAGLLLAWLTRGRAGVADLGRRLIDVGRIGPRWWLVILCFWPAFNLAMAGAGLTLGVTSEPLAYVSPDRLFDPVAVGSMVAFAFLFPLVEEVGLRGYWLDRLQDRWSALASGLLNGTTWAVWHAPLVFLPGYYAGTTFEPELSWWLPSIVLSALLYVWIYN